MPPRCLIFPLTDVPGPGRSRCVYTNRRDYAATLPDLPVNRRPWPWSISVRIHEPTRRCRVLTISTAAYDTQRPAYTLAVTEGILPSSEYGVDSRRNVPGRSRYRGVYK
ncbi:BESS motif [Popillia japonica]|uniref:BESS motif n=1 Tax=Popillia japonica TaxID=7064 RepID=A0AAW1LVN9_POPJA